MTAASAVGRGRAAIERIMADACVVTRTGAAGSFDPDTGSQGTGTGETVYEGPCRVRARNAREVLAGEQEVGLNEFVVSVPWDTTDVARGDVLTLTRSADPWLTGKALTVTGVQAATHSTARRLLCELA